MASMETSQHLSLPISDRYLCRTFFGLLVNLIEGFTFSNRKKLCNRSTLVFYKVYWASFIALGGQLCGFFWYCLLFFCEACISFSVRIVVHRIFDFFYFG